MYNHRSGIHLRKVHKGDLFTLLRLKEESWWGTHSTCIMNIEDQLHWYENLPKNSLNLIAEKETGDAKKPFEILGVGCYQNIDNYARSLSISGSILKEHRKMDDIVRPAFSAGVDFAFEVLNMQRLEAEVLETHAAAQQLEVGFLGFKIEGRRRKAVYKSGKYYDSILLGLLREEWETSSRVVSYGDEGCNNNFDHVAAKKYSERFRRLYGDQLSIVGSSPDDLK